MPCRALRWLAALLSTVAPAALSAQTLTIDGAVTFQTIEGLGTNINSLSWTNANSRAAIDQLADQMGQSAWRVVFDMMDWEDPNDNADPLVADPAYYAALYGNAKFQNLWGTLRYLNQKGFDGAVMLSFMGPLSTWMGGASVSAANEEEVVEAIVSLVDWSRNVEHVRFGTLDPFNESDWNGNEGPQLSAAQYARLLGRISARLEALGIGDVRFIGPNTASLSAGVSSWLPAMMGNAALMAKVDRFGFHDYGANAAGVDSVIRASAYPTRTFWMTEYAVPEHAFRFFEQGASGLLVWEGFDSIYNHAIARGEPAVPGNDDVGSVPLAYNATNPVSYTPRKEFYKNAQFFRFIPLGAVRIEASSALDAVAFHHVASGRVVAVLGNSGGPAVTVSGTLRNLPAVARFSVVLTDGSRDLAPAPDVVVTGGAFTVQVPARSIVTLSSAGVAVPDAGIVDASPRDAASQPDAGVQPGDGGFTDAGLSEVDAAPSDAGSAPDDGGAGAVDAGSAPDDGGAGAVDAGAAPDDGGAGAVDAGAALDDGGAGADAALDDGGAGADAAASLDPDGRVRGRAATGGCGCDAAAGAGPSPFAVGLFLLLARRARRQTPDATREGAAPRDSAGARAQRPTLARRARRAR